jgi:hypothetical protein
MSPAEPLFPPTTPPAARAAQAHALIDRQLAMLTRLAEIGMEIAEAAGRRACALAEGGEAAPSLVAQGPDPGLAYARAARAVRLTIALQSRLAKDLAALDEAQARANGAEAARRRDRAHAHVEQAAEDQRDDTDEVEALSSRAWERLTDLDDDDLLLRPIGEVVARICEDLGLSPAFVASAFPDAPSAPRVPAASSTWEDLRVMHRPLAGPGLRPSTARQSRRHAQHAVAQGP